MKIDYVSDLHINHYVRFNDNQIKFERKTREWSIKLLEAGDGEVLIIAGDFGEINKQALWFVEEAAEQYKKVFVTLGNHDFYVINNSQKKKYGDSKGRTKELVDMISRINNVTVFDIGGTEIYKGVKFAGSPLWYLPKSEAGINFFKNISNDSNYIFLKYSNPLTSIRSLWTETITWYQKLGEVDVMFTHVPPVHSPFLNHKPNECYMVDVSEIKAKHWIFGHDHSRGEFSKAGTNFYSNCIGYPHEGKELRLRSFDI